METRRLRIGTRASALAMAQAHETRSRLMAAHDLPESAFEIVAMTTSGDRIQDRALAEAGGKGLFTKEIEEALLAGDIDIAVHSSKDMPTLLPDGLAMEIFLEREDVRDGFIGGAAPRLADLPHGATVGTSSLRRQALVRRTRPDLNVVTYRGNVQTRLAKLRDKVADATLLAMAGLSRLGMTEVATEVLAPRDFPPAPGQGAIGIETRRGDDRTLSMLASIHHETTGRALACERAFLAALDGSCRTPIAAHAVVEEGTVRFYGMILTPDGRQVHETDETGGVADAAAIGRQAGETLRRAAGPRFFESWG